jgi:hypothetical protein
MQPGAFPTTQNNIVGSDDFHRDLCGDHPAVFESVRNGRPVAAVRFSGSKTGEESPLAKTPAGAI